MLNKFHNCLDKLQKKENLIDTFDEIAELLILGDQKEQDIFDTFIENKSLELILKTLQRTKDNNVVNSVLENLSKIIINVKHNLIPLLSQPTLNEFIIFKYNYQEEETIDYYINFLKILASTIDKNNIHLFFNKVYILIDFTKRYPYFPLVIFSQSFCNHKSQLIRTTSHNILLNIMKNIKGSICEQELKEYFNSYPFLQILVNYAILLKNKQLDWITKGINQDILQDTYELIQDIYTNCEFLRDNFDNVFLHYVVLPILQHKSDFQVSLIILLQFYQQRFSDTLLDGITKLILLPTLPKISIKTEFEDIDVATLYFNENQNNEKVGNSLFIITNWLTQISNFQYDEHKSQLNDVVSFDLIQKLRDTQIFQENVINDVERTPNLYYIYSLNSTDPLVLDCIIQLIKNILEENLYLFLEKEERYVHLINLLDYYANSRYQSVVIRMEFKFRILQLIQLLTIKEDMKNFYQSYVKLYIKPQLEQTLIENGQNLYFSFDLILKNIEDQQYLLNLIEQFPDLQCFIEYLVLINWISKQQIINYPFKMIQTKGDFGDKIFEIANNEDIIFQDYEIKYKFQVFQLNKWIIKSINENQDSLILKDVVNEKTEIIFCDKQSSDIIQEWDNRNTFARQKFISSILEQIQQL